MFTVLGLGYLGFLRFGGGFQSSGFRLHPFEFRVQRLDCVQGFGFWVFGVFRV